jgi:putative aldouronate transport system substrate-binding protein
MNAKKKNLVSFLAVLSATAVLAAGCGNSGDSSDGEATATSKASTAPAATSSAPVKLTLVQQDGGRVWKDDNPGTLEIMKKTNTKLEATMIPSGEFMNKYNVLAASGSIPDINKIPNFEFQKYADNGLFLDVKDLVDKHAPNLKKAIAPELWDLVKYKGKQLAIPYANVPGKIVPSVRQDWLDTLGIKMPSDLNEYEEMLKKFTFGDPDKNGKDDTYGLGASGGWKGDFTMIFGAFGVMPFDSGDIRQSYLKDGTIYSSQISNEYRDAIAYIKKLWDAKVIDPEIFIIKADQANQKLVQSKAGTFTSWWSIAPAVLTGNLKMNEINPKAKWNPILPAIKGPAGKSGLESRGSINGTINISAKTKDPVAAIKFLDFLASDEGWELATYGIKGQHYTDLVQGRTPEGKKAMDEKWLDPLAQIIYRPDIVDKVNNASKDPAQIEANRFIMAAREYNLYADIFFGVPITDSQKNLGPDLTKFEEEMFIKFVTGAEPLSKWNEYVENWKKKGGKEILESRVKAYNDLRGTSYKAGI